MNLTLVRIQVSPAVISSIQKVWAKVNPDAPFNYYFLDDRIKQQYESEMKLGTLMTAATGLAVVIACLGLLGLVSFSANQGDWYPESIGSIQYSGGCLTFW
jgi:hypothetical protein